MAENYSVQAVLSARDSGFTSTFKSAASAVDNLSQKSSGGFKGLFSKASSGFQNLLGKGSGVLSSSTGGFQGMGSSADSITSRLTSGLGFGVLMSIGSRATGAIIDGIRGIVSELGSSSAAWQTFDANMSMIGKSSDEIAGTKKELQKFAQETIYSASDMAQTYSQMAAVGVKDTTRLVKGFGGLAAAAENPAQAMKTLSQQGTQMAAKPKIAWMDFKLMLEQTPAGMAAVAKQMGMSLDQLVSQVQAGTIKTADFFKAVADVGTNADFTKLATSYKTVGQAMDGLKETAANQLMPAFQKLQQVGIKAVSAITDILGGFDASALADRIAPFTDALSNLIDALTSGDVQKVKDSVLDLFQSLPAPIQQAGAAFAAFQGLKLVGPAFNPEIWRRISGGINLAGDAAGKLPSAFMAFQGALPGALSQVQSFGQTMHAVAKGSFDLWVQSGSRAGTAVGGFASKISGALGPISSQIDGFAGKISGMGGQVGGAISGIISKLQPLTGAFTSFASGFMGDLSSMIGTGLKMLFPAAAIGVVLAGLGLLYQQFGGQIDQMLAMVQEKGPEIIQNFVIGIDTQLPALIEAGGQMVTNLLNTFTTLAPYLVNAGVNLVSNLVFGLAEALPTLVLAALQAITTFAGSILENIPHMIYVGMTLLAGLVEGIVNAIPSVLESAAESIEGFADGIEGNLPAILQKGIQIIVSLVNGIITNLPQIAMAAGRIIVALIRVIITSLPQIAGAALQLMGELAGALIRGIPKAIAAIGDLAKEILNGVRSINLLDAGKAVINGFLNGLKSAFGAVKDFIGGIGDWILKHKGPLPYDRRMLIPAGHAIMGGFNKGLQSKFSSVKSTISGISRMVANAMSITPTPRMAYSMAGTAQLSEDYNYGPQVVNVNVISEMDGRAVGYGSARYVNEKNTFENQRKQRIGGTNV